MQIYLPIAEISLNVMTLLALGAAVGFLSGLFGVGGGFLMTPLLIFLGVPPPVAVATQANQLAGASLSGVLAQWRRNAVDLRIGMVMVLGGTLGTVLGVWIFGVLQRLGQIDLVISLLYVGFLGVIGLLMLWESARALLRQRRKTAQRGRLHRHTWLHGLPLKMRFPKSRLYISALLPGAIGFLGGLLVAVMGIGGGFVLIPLMIYVLNMPTGMVPGTSLLQIIFSTAIATWLHAVNNGTVDVLLAFILLVGGVAGAQFGARSGVKLRGEQARALLALMVLAVCVKLGWDLGTRPDDLYELTLEAP